MTASESQPLIDSLPPAPRPINPRAARRSWAEAPVRIWAILSIIVLVVTIYFTVSQVSAALATRRLIFHGTAVMAHVDAANGVKDRGRRYDRRDRIGADLTFTAPDGTRQTVQGELSPQSGFLTVGGTIDLRVDPNDPTVWTDRITPPPWHTELSAVIILVPLLLLSVLMMLWRRVQVLAVWRRGEPMSGIVVDSKQSAIAPRSRVVRFALMDGNDRRVFHVLYPTRAGEPGKGDELLLIAPPLKPSRAIVADLYICKPPVPLV
jgi:hypothetical protein